MHRRAFLAGSACGIGAATVVGPARGFIAEQSAQVLRLDSEAGVWHPFLADAARPQDVPVQRLRLLGPRLAEGTRLRSLQLDLLYGAEASSPARHRAWRFDASRVEGNSGDCSLRLPSHGLALQFRLASDEDTRPGYLTVHAAHWPEGDYLVRLDAAPTRALACGPAGHCATPAGIDGFLLQVRREPEAPDLCLRADLACERLAQASASVTA
ncbi:MAG: hypothetical protein MEQ07_11140 [Aquimonas sp.]|nr:hypothetical protein [Aquimonas sp.]